MNALFVNIKVDREERPDLDKVQQIAQQMLTQRPGGWPLTMFLAPEDHTPFFGGTYFPKEARQGMPAFQDILQRVAEYYHANRETIAAQHVEFVAAYARLTPTPGDAGLILDDSPLAALRADLAQCFDAEWGGFGRAPKFPHPTIIDHCLRAWQRSAAATDPDLHSLYMATLSLTRMADGGIYDQLAGGFYRYSVDDHWMIPHFEKMLYDNGPLLANFAQAALATGEGLFARIAQETADWLLRDLRSADGGFFSAYDADSGGHEGAFYVWDTNEVRALLAPAEFDLVAAHFGLNNAANFEGRWHLHVTQPHATATTDAARIKLLRARERRVWPARDDKVLTAWNALAIKGLAIASRNFDRAEFAQAACDAVDFIRAQLWREGRLYAVSAQGQARHPAYLDDHAFLAEALLELLQTKWRSQDLVFLRELLEVMLDQFEDPVDHGFFFTAHGHERLLHRMKSFADEAIPSGNGVAAAVLCRAGYLLGEMRYIAAAERTLRAGWHALNQYPRGHVSLINALEDFLQSLQIVILRGPREEIDSWAQRLARRYAPRRLCFAIPDDAADLPDAIAEKRMHGASTAYVCTGMTCGAPITAFSELLRALERSGV